MKLFSTLPVHVLAAVTVKPEYLVIGLMGVVLAVLAVKVLFRRDDQVEERRKDAIKIAEYFNQIGFDNCAVFFTCYAVGDYSGMWKSVRVILGILGDPATKAASMRKIRDSLVKLALDDPAERKSLLELIASRIDITLPAEETATVIKTAKAK